MGVCFEGWSLPTSALGQETGFDSFNNNCFCIPRTVLSFSCAAINIHSEVFKPCLFFMHMADPKQVEEKYGRPYICLICEVLGKYPKCHVLW